MGNGKPTRFLTNSWYVAEALSTRCQNVNREVKQQHRHVKLIGGRRAREAQEYPRKLCESMVDGMRRQIEADEWWIVKVSIKSTRVAEGEKEPEHDNDEEEALGKQWAWDDITGAVLDPKVVADERKKEIWYIHKHGVYRKVRRSSVPPDGKIIQVRWIDINKGDETNPNIRSRLVAKDF